MNVQDWTVIVVEDTYDDIELASTILRHYGIKVETANNGKECLKLLKHVQPTLIITDLSMPHMDGWEMLQQIRTNGLTQHIPVVAVTAYDSLDVAHDAVGAGFDAYVPKPLSPRNLIEQLQQILQSD